MTDNIYIVTLELVMAIQADNAGMAAKLAKRRVGPVQYTTMQVVRNELYVDMLKAQISGSKTDD